MTDPTARNGPDDAARGDDALVPISALQHYVYCPRQCALIHLEDQWRDNRWTTEGTDLHERVDLTGRRHESRGNVRIARRLELSCRSLGLVGRADVVEMHRVSDDEPGVELPKTEGRWRPFPVEYKRGRPKVHDADRVQLCAQALCLESMLGVPVPIGALFYGEPRRRFDVEIDAALRAITVETIRAVHALFTQSRTPTSRRAPKCRRCSLEALCLPDATARSGAARAYLTRALRNLSVTREPG